MQFKHPEILYALLLIIIPIIVHLFQLQRFKKTPFTNVQFLKKLKLQTRKSSRLKKWLILLTRILAFMAIIFAFSQPFFSNKKQHQKYTTTIYLDNSWSMQFKNQEGELLRNAIQQIIKNLNPSNTISLITNNKIFKNLNTKELKNVLLNTQYSAKKIDFNTILLKNNQLKLNASNTIDNLILISDFQNINSYKKQYVTNVNSHIFLIDVAEGNAKNISIDSVYVFKTTSKKTTLKVHLKSININVDNLSISLYNDTFLVAKTTTPILKNKISTVEFNIPNKESFNGIIKIEDSNLTFDNTLFFTISNPKKINVISIGKKANFLTKIYTKNEFNFSQKNLNNLNYNTLQNQNLIILNELEKIPTSLKNLLNKFLKNGGNIVIIPSEKSNIDSYNKLLNQLKIGTISKPIQKELKITTLHFSHPLLNDVFEKKILNFQYPNVKMYYELATNYSYPIVTFENERSFLSEIKKNKGSIYFFTSPINKNISNFTNSPLIVPIFYNFGKYSFKIPQLYYTLGYENRIDVNITIEKDDILKLKSEFDEFIPLQQVFRNKVQLTTNEQPIISGFYQITNNNKPLRPIAYNYDRKESELTYLNVNQLFKNVENVTISNSIEKTFTQLNKQQEIKSLFKWFITLGFLLLILEIFILKFFKI